MSIKTYRQALHDTLRSEMLRDENVFLMGEEIGVNFSLLALDQIVNHAAKIYGMFGGQTSVPLVIRTPGGGGQQLGATHSQTIDLYYAFVPGM